MKKLILISIIGILLIGSFVVGIVTREIKMDSHAKEMLKEIGLEDYEKTYYEINGKQMVNLKKESCKSITYELERYWDEEGEVIIIESSYIKCSNIINKDSPILTDRKELDKWEFNYLNNTLPNAIESRKESKVETNKEEVIIVDVKGVIR